jgi:hypothetical protein
VLAVVVDIVVVDIVVVVVVVVVDIVVVDIVVVVVLVVLAAVVVSAIVQYSVQYSKEVRMCEIKNAILAGELRRRATCAAEAAIRRRQKQSMKKS